MNKRITVLPGDGIGPEIAYAARSVLDVAGDSFEFNYEIDEQFIGGIAVDECGDPFPVETEEACIKSDAVLLGAVGAPAYDSLPTEKRPEQGLLRLRKALGGFANLRPARAVTSILECSPLKTETFRDTDLLIVRELLGGIYFGQPREKTASRALDTLVYERHEIERIARVAFEAASKRRNRLTSVDKANVLDSSRLWRETVEEISREYPDVELEHMYVDACAMHLITNPRHFDVIVTGNMFGDILSDEASVLTGSIGVLHSATIGGSVDLYEPIHGSAPDIAGKGTANPIGMVNSIAAMFEFTFDRKDIARAIERAVENALEEGIRTADIAVDTEPVTTIEMTEAIIRQFKAISTEKTQVALG